MRREIIYSVTLAEIYLKQGSKQKAFEIYEYLLSKDPNREDVRARLEKLREEMERKGTFSKIKEVIKKKVL
ncbi:MAG: hypothetical protein N2513_09140 [Deltaproteobacteria bacterium]|nr:hypothetical protein [Deltaproteobacteria bacterium]